MSEEKPPRLARAMRRRFLCAPRAARRQEFLRQAKQQLGLGRLLRDRDELLGIFGSYTQSDIAKASNAEIMQLLKLGYEASKNPTREIRFPGVQEPGDSYVRISRGALDDTVRRFLAVTPSAPRQGTAGPRAPRPPQGQAAGGLAPGLLPAAQEGEDRVLDMATRMPGLPVYFPGTRLARGGYVPDTAVPGERVPRSYDLYDQDRRAHRAYRIVLSAGENGQYYGVQGTTWRDPPILTGATDRVRMRGRTYERFFDGRRLRMVAWRPPDGRAAYWVTNSLSQRLSNRQMMGIARSLQRVGR